MAGMQVAPQAAESRGPPPAAASAGQGGAAAAGRGAMRGARRPREVNMDDVYRTKPPTFVTKQGTFNPKTDKKTLCIANFFPLKQRPDFSVLQYSISYRCEGDIHNQTGKKRYLMSQLKNDLPAQRLFTGDAMFTIQRLANDTFVKTAFYDFNDERVPVEITIKLVKSVEHTDPGYIQMLNHINDEQLRTMGLAAVGRSHFDITAKTVFERHRLEIWPGISSTIRWQERDLMLKVELTNKVVRKDTAYDTLSQLRDPIRCKQALLGSVVVTAYNNNKTYRIDDIDFTKNPETARFEHSQFGTISLKEYFDRQYQRRIRDLRQPLLISMPRKRDVRSGQITPILLIPELCQMTGLTDDLRSNFRAMQDMAGCLKMNPDRKLDTLLKYGKRFADADAKTKVLTSWGMKVDPNPVKIQTRVIGNQAIFLSDRQGRERIVQYDSPFKSEWSNSLRNGMLTTAKLQNWCVLYPGRLKGDVTDFFDALKRVSVNLGLNIMGLPQWEELQDDRAATFVAKLRDVVARKPYFIVCVFHRQNQDTYKAVKNELLVRSGIPNQVLVANKSMSRDKKGGMKLAVATKVAVQIACKLGAVPWKVSAPLSNTMIVGFDTFHNKKSGRKSVGALCASVDANWCSYYSQTSQHEEQNEISDSMGQLFSDALRFYKQRNNQNPSRIFFYRDGVGEGQIQHIHQTEVRKLKEVIDSIPGEVRPKLTVTIVSKRIAPRFFKQDNGSISNPSPGTVVDDVVTLPERFDFYLVSQCVTEGTVNPTSYNIILDENALPADRHQLLAYKMCHLYPNWPGTIRVPSPCQLAHKLAYLLGENGLDNAHKDLRGTLFCL